MWSQMIFRMVQNYTYETCCAHYIRSLGFYCYYLVNTSVGGLLILPRVVSASTLTWFIRYIYYWNLQFLNNVHYQDYGQSASGIGNCSQFWLSCLVPLVYFLSKNIKLLGFQIIFIFYCEMVKIFTERENYNIRKCCCWYIWFKNLYARCILFFLEAFI